MLIDALIFWCGNVRHQISPLKQKDTQSCARPGKLYVLHCLLKDCASVDHPMVSFTSNSFDHQCHSQIAGPEANVMKELHAQWVGYPPKSPFSIMLQPIRTMIRCLRVGHSVAKHCQSHLRHTRARVMPMMMMPPWECSAQRPPGPPGPPGPWSERGAKDGPTLAD